MVCSAKITTTVPERPAGQTDMIEFAAAPIETVRVGFVGLGMRGPDAVDRFVHIPGTKVVALCDVEADRVAKAQKFLTKAGLPEAAAYSGDTEAWKKMVDRDDIDLIYIATDWVHHYPIAIYAMEHGKHVAIEVPSALNMDEIWGLINTSERTRKHCMMLENCCYDFFEMNTLYMAQQGLFGEVIHTEGSYIHNLKEFWPYYWNKWRSEYNNEHRGDVYPTHGVGPACQLLNIHRGDRMTNLVAMDTDPFNGPKDYEEATGKSGDNYKNGDHTMTLIRTAKGKTIQIQHDVVNPRPYSRMYQLTGTKGFANKYPKEGYAFEPEQIASDDVPDHQNLSAHGFISDEQRAALEKKYTHPIIREVGELAKEVGGHGGMDYIMDYRLVYCLQNGLPLDMDVYDLAEWCCLAPLSEISLAHDSEPVEVPDFTRGGWQKVNGYHHHYKK
jgi:predicted dehydrogenase